MGRLQANELREQIKYDCPLYCSNLVGNCDSCKHITTCDAIGQIGVEMKVELRNFYNEPADDGQVERMTNALLTNQIKWLDEELQNG